MQDETQVTPDTSEQENVVEVDDNETTTEPEANVEEKDWEAEARKAQEVADNYKKRAEKAEKKAKEVKTEATKVELSQTDVIALAKSDIHEEDIERVTKFAQMEGISVKDALSNEDMKAILERRSEARKAAAASNTSANKGGAVNVSGDSLLENARSGKLPDPKDLDKMWDAEIKK